MTKRVIVLKPGEGIPDEFEGAEDVDVTSYSQSPLSPFLIGGTHASDVNSRPGVWYHNFENMWQYSKVYRFLGHIQEDGGVSDEWYKWSDQGAKEHRANRYPAGRGAKPEFLMWQGRKLSYVAARKLVYLPKYMECIRANPSAYTEFNRLHDIIQDGGLLVLRDFDCYAVKGKYPWQDMIDNPHRKFGHGLALAHALERSSLNAHMEIIV